MLLASLIELFASNVLFFSVIAVATAVLLGVIVAGIQKRHTRWGKPAAILAGCLLACLTGFVGLVALLVVSSQAGAPM